MCGVDFDFTGSILVSAEGKNVFKVVLKLTMDLCKF